MADYWVSQNRKYCDFCKCWITDNRPSIDFHEKGRRHQENVKKKLRNISKHSAQVQKDSDKFDATIKQIESAALESYRKDVENNADLTSQAINAGNIKKLWNEAKGRDGKTYYINVMTKETVYTPPKEGYMSLEEQKQQALDEAKKQLDALEKFKRRQGLLNLQTLKQQEEEERARIAREKLKERRVVDDLPPETCGPLIEPGKTDPYGKWQVVKESEVVYDLQLPHQEAYYPPTVEYEAEPVVKEFKEKIVASLDDNEGETTFKKRKIGGGTKRNTRQRLDDD